METLSTLHRLLDHVEWANRRALEAIEASGNREALRLLAHVVGTEAVWLSRLRTGDSSDLAIWPEADSEDWGRRLTESVQAYRSFLEGLNPTDLNRKATYRNSKGVEFHTPVGEVLLHVLLHGSYHRGQIALRLRDAGEEPVNTDFITFVREHPPESD